jgi:hypothetical protein
MQPDMGGAERESGLAGRRGQAPSGSGDPRRRSPPAAPPLGPHMPPASPASRARAPLAGCVSAPLAGSSAYTRHSMAQPLSRLDSCSWVSGRRRPAAVASISSTRSTPVMASVMGCSTCSRVFICRRAGGRPAQGQAVLWKGSSLHCQRPALRPQLRALL